MIAPPLSSCYKMWDWLLCLLRCRTSSFSLLCRYECSSCVVISYLLSRCLNKSGGLFYMTISCPRPKLLVLIGLPCLLAPVNPPKKRKEMSEQGNNKGKKGLYMPRSFLRKERNKRNCISAGPACPLPLRSQPHPSRTAPPGASF